VLNSCGDKDITMPLNKCLKLTEEFFKYVLSPL